MMESGVPLCNSCGDQLGLISNGEIFVACHECNYPICRSCVEFELKEGRASCLRCGTPYDGTDDLNSFQLHFCFITFICS